ncbi:MAG TPA: hypothetical protein VH165_20815 [Kofleriaceae bacterium]|jgi:hypothetical protein|nr:hypothetical protein [Kofleriaceae bacterium]
MKLVEAESTGPVEGDDAQVTPPRLPHRRVSVSLLFTLTVLIGTVVTIYLVFPARHNVLMTEALELHRDIGPGSAWDLAAPGQAELRGWAIGVVGKDVPLPGDDTAAGATVIGASRRQILNRAAAVLRVRIGGDEITYLVQHARGIAPDRSERQDGELHALAWRAGPYTVVAVGPDATAASWRTAFKQ